MKIPRLRLSRNDIINLIATVVSAVPPVLATLSRMPLTSNKLVWAGLGCGTIIAIIVLLFCFRRQIGALARRFPLVSTAVVWLVLRLIAHKLTYVFDNLNIIAFWGLVGCALGALIHVTAFLMSYDDADEISSESEATKQ